MNITKEAIEAFYSKAEVTRHGTILHLEAALTAAYAAMPAGVVKPLEWHAITSPREDGPPEPTGDIEANTMIGEYSVCFDEDEAVAGTPWCCWSPVECVGHFADFEAAKSAAQADYSARIMSALEPAGVGAVEAPQLSIHKRGSQNRWSIDHSAGRPILMLDGCSVIESEDAEYLLRLIKNDQAKNREASTPAALKDPLKERLKAGTVHYARQESDRS